jgi:hypothetical protein
MQPKHLVDRIIAPSTRSFWRAGRRMPGYSIFRFYSWLCLWSLAIPLYRHWHRRTPPGALRASGHCAVRARVGCPELPAPLSRGADRGRLQTPIMAKFVPLECRPPVDQYQRAAADTRPRTGDPVYKSACYHSRKPRPYRCTGLPLPHGAVRTPACRWTYAW